MEKIKGMCRNEACDHFEEIFEVEKTDPRCPYCTKELFLMENLSGGDGPKGQNWKLIAGSVAAAALLGGGAYFAFSGGGEEGSITLSKTTASVFAGDVDTLKVTVKPEDAGYTLKWASNNPEVATVDNGIVTFHTKGEAKIGVQVNEDKELKAFCDYLVDAKIAPTTTPEEETDKNPPVTKPETTTGTLTLSYGKYTGEIKNGKPNGQGRLVYTKEHLINKNDLKERMAQPGESVQGIFVNGEITIGQHFDEEGNLLHGLNFGVSPEDE